MTDQTLVNDIHSQLNPTTVRAVLVPDAVTEVPRAIRQARDAGVGLSIAGGRHAMGGQQFLDGGLLLDMRRLNRIIDLDAERGLVRVEAGILWDDLVEGLRVLQRDTPSRWSVVQKQTGADRLSVGGALAANGHGRGLTYKPIVQDVESFVLADANGDLLNCSRTENAELFRLAIGGYGLFGVICSVDLRLMPAHRVQRVVEITDLERLEARFRERIRDGFTYGDFQYMTDETSPGFLREGVLSCYRPLTPAEAGDYQEPRYLLTEQDWRRLLYLSHADKARAFQEYTAFYQSTNGQTYDSDTFQLSMYIDDYHLELDRRLQTHCHCTETITEVYVPLPELADFMGAARRELLGRRANVIYGTIRLIERDDETFLNWARQPYACIVFNLHVEHTTQGIQKVAEELRTLIDLAADRDGSYFLTYNKFATPAQVARCYPQFADFLAQKRIYDPPEVFSSDWYQAYRCLG